MEKITKLDPGWERLLSQKPIKLNGNGYAFIYVGNYKIELVHRIIMGALPNQEIDHINGDRLDNRRENLRFVTRSQNNANMKPRKGTSKYKGVCWDKARSKWLAQTKKDKKRYNLGRFNCEAEAAKAYNKKALELFGEYARLNTIT